jgi:outer membrane lipoprotein-sorting protein
MKKTLTLAIAALAAAASLFAALPTAEQLLTGIDRSRNGWSSYVVDVKISNFKGGKAADTNAYQVFIKGADRTLVKFMSPMDKGKSMLMLDGGMWLFLPTAGRPIRVTPLQRLSGNASNGDVAQTSLAANYTPALAGEETVDGKASWILELDSKKKSSTYQHVKLWIGKDDLLPIRAEFRLTSGKPSKRVDYVEYQKVAGGQMLLKRQVMYDLMRNDQKTIMEYGNYTQRELPDSLFNQNSLR